MPNTESYFLRLMIIFKTAKDSLEFETAGKLFAEYAVQLNVDLSFQSFEEELAAIHVLYNLPSGGLIIAYDDDKPMACGAIRKFEDDVAELKRMYVREEYRGSGVGRELLNELLRKAKALGYTRIRLDTLPGMESAQRLYRALGFYEIMPYRFNPIEGTLYFEKVLK